MSDALSPLRLLIVFLGLLFPTLALIPLGSLWLWQHGYLIYWAIATLCCTLIAFVFQRRTLGPPPKAGTDEPVAEIIPPRSSSDGDPMRAAAQRSVDTFASDANTRTIGSWNDLLNTGLETVEIVAKTYHPDRKDPMLRFTVPEALTLIEQVSARLRPVFEGTIPLGNRLTVAQFAQVYRWRGIYDVAGRAWSVWRLARMFNPATAATYELREKLSNSLIQWLKGTISGRLVRAFIQEVGAASIDLYSGELKKAASARKTANLPATIPKQ
ncbi:GTP-binding protein HSR1 [Hyphomicrobium sp.]|uniref:GTP-binding protein HSR1 n=1 Tax=Hyphomicrobium sp. TaxID=82 RepID=UPI001DCFBA3F|nr:GTP-binding protein HSR1 [Hyphomicrobium sp.]MBY0559265.1 GTP-binding protein HSR1 [Hyphomicrobium sp.]